MPSSKKSVSEAAKREFDIVVHGATGFTGRLISAYLAQSPSAAKVKWAISGRHKSRVDELAKNCLNDTAFSFGTDKAGTNAPETIVADSLKDEDMAALTKRARVVIACAGPFSLYGMPLAKACVANGAHYVDITGEFPYVRLLIEELDAKAKASKVLLLPCSGFDCVASDITNYHAYETANKEGVVLRRVEVAFQSKGGGASRGTLESVLHITKSFKKPDFSPLSLVNATDARKGTPTPATKWLHWHPALKKWVGPFFMSAINERIVRRTNSLLPSRAKEGAYNSYVEMYQGTLLQCAVIALAGVLMLLAAVPGVGGLLRRFVFPAEREGPKLTGTWRATALGYVSTATKMPVVEARVTSNVDPYRFTAIAAVETALALANNELDDEAEEGGVRTAGSTVAKALRRRLEESAYIRFDTLRGNAANSS